MKRTLFTVAIAVTIVFTGCVSLSEHEDLLSKYELTNRQYTLQQQELLELKDENATLTKQNQALSSEYTDVALARSMAEQKADSLSRRIEQMAQHYDTTMENYLQEVAGKSRDLTRAQNLLTARTKELADKERELEAVRSAVTRALTGFADKGLKVEVKDSKVYVSMENKLLFPSASWTVSKEGVNAIKELAKVLEQDSSLNIMVEGHTDNDAYRGSTAVKDNWDLSVMRATAIVKLLLQNGKGINPARIEACGHGEYAPKVPNDTPEGKAINRRTEIILTPNLDKLLEEVGR